MDDEKRRETGKAKEDTNRKLLRYLENSPSAYHAVEGLKKELKAAGFRELPESEAWDITSGGKYFVTRNDSAIVSFILSEERPESFHVIASHSDSPSFKIKPGPGILTGQMLRLNVERYGGPIERSWLDRPLSVAGRVLIDEGDHLRQELVRPPEDIILIPSLAPHLSRDKQEEKGLNVQTDLLPLFAAGTDDENAFWNYIAGKLGVKTEAILDADLSLCVRERPRVWGSREEFISAPHLDDLECAYCSFLGFLESRPADSVAVHCVFDNEEVGSRSRQGADSGFLRDVLRRVCMALRLGDEEYHRMISRSFMVSADNAHAVHPNAAHMSDPVNRPHMNGGIVIKHQGSLRYATDAVSAAIVKKICREHEIPWQEYTNRSDIQGGSTLGSLSQSQLPLLTADIGLAQLAMHSCFETAGAEDTRLLADFSKAFFSERLPELEK